MSDRAVVQWGVPLVVLFAGIALMGIFLLFPQKEDRIVYRYVNHPKGVIEMPKYADRVEIVDGMTKDCVLYSNFDPEKASGFVVGQRLISDCSIVKTGPKG